MRAFQVVGMFRVVACWICSKQRRIRRRPRRERSA